jgi:hypothetical protein
LNSEYQTVYRFIGCCSYLKTFLLHSWLNIWILMSESSWSEGVLVVNDGSFLGDPIDFFNDK